MSEQPLPSLAVIASLAYAKGLDDRLHLQPHGVWKAVALAVAAEVLRDPARWARALGIPLGKPVDETAYLQARIGTIREMISHMTPADFLTRLSLEESQAQMEAELAELTHQMAPYDSNPPSEP